MKTKTWLMSKTLCSLKANECIYLQKTSLTGLLLLVLTSLAFITSCSSYDEEDVTIISYLKINDLIENKLSKTCNEELDTYNKAVKKYKEQVSANALARFLGFGSIGVEEFPYDEDVIAVFNKKYYNKQSEIYNMDALEAAITAELWAYMDFCYEDAIPSKAQNADEGRYYTISELKSKYPEYNDVEVEEFRPMPLITTVVNEALFDISLISDGDINLYTLYTFMLNQQKTSGNTDNSDKKKYLEIIATHCPNGMPSDEETDYIFDLFDINSATDEDRYTHDLDGFKKFADEYFETDIFNALH